MQHRSRELTAELGTVQLFGLYASTPEGVCVRAANLLLAQVPPQYLPLHSLWNRTHEL